MTEIEVNQAILEKLRKFNVTQRTDEDLLEIFKARTTYKSGSKDYALTGSQKLDFLHFSEEHNLNPLRDVWACAIGGVVRPYILIDGWHNILQKHMASGKIQSIEWSGSDPEEISIKGAEFISPKWVKCTITLSNGSKGESLGYISDYFVSTNAVWIKHAGKMLQNKVLANAIKMYIGTAGLYDDDDIAKIEMSSATEINTVSTNAGDLIRSLRQYANVKKIFFSQTGTMLYVQADLEFSKILKEKNFSFNKTNSLWEMPVNGVDKNDVDTLLTYNRIPYKAQKGRNAGSDKMFYQVQNPSAQQRQILLDLGFQPFQEKGYIRSV